MKRNSSDLYINQTGARFVSPKQYVRTCQKGIQKGTI